MKFLAYLSALIAATTATNLAKSTKVDYHHPKMIDQKPAPTFFLKVYGQETHKRGKGALSNGAYVAYTDAAPHWMRAVYGLKEAMPF